MADDDTHASPGSEGVFELTESLKSERTVREVNA